MSETSEHGRFTCDGCGKSYRWKPELAGKKAKCKCGSTMTVPAEDPAAAGVDDLGDLYALAEDANAKKHQPASTALRCPSCGGEMAPGAVICVGCGYDMRSGKKMSAKVMPAMAAGGGAAVATARSPMLAYAGTTKKELGKDEVGESKMQDYYLPAALAAFGILFQFLDLTVFTSHPTAMKYAIPWVAVSVFFDLILLSIGCLIGVKLIDISLGAPGPAALKLAAIALAPGAIGDAIDKLMPGYFMGWLVQIVVFLALFRYLFDLDLNEVLLLTGILVVLRWFMRVFIFVAIIALLFGSGGSKIGALADAATGGGDSSSVHSNAHERSNSDIEEEISNTKHAAEAQSWLDESPGRIFGALGHAVCVDMTKNLYAMGATKVTAVKDGPEASNVVVTLPKAKDARKKIFDWHKQNAEKYGWDEEDDTGQKYLELDFSN
jgi:hypothetical protein